MKIHIKKSHEGRFTAYKERTGKTTEEALHSKDPHVRKMANFAKQAAKWSKKEFGGTLSSDHPLSKFIKMYAEGGSVTGDDPEGSGTSGAMTMDSAPQTAESATQDANTANQQMGIAYDPGTDPNNPVNNDVRNGVAGYSAYPDAQKKKPNTTARDVYGNLLGSGLIATSFFEDKRNQRNAAGYNRQQGITDNVFGAQKISSQQGQRGDYNQNGAFRPNSGTPYNPGIQYPQQQYGGKQGGYAVGQEIEMDDRELENLRKQGYKFNIL